MTFFLLQMLFTTSVFCNKHLDGYYLFVYFTGNQTSKQQICYALSSDGIDFVPLNGGHPVIASDSIAVMKGFVTRIFCVELMVGFIWLPQIWIGQKGNGLIEG